MSGSSAAGSPAKKRPSPTAAAQSAATPALTDEAKLAEISSALGVIGKYCFEEKLLLKAVKAISEEGQQNLETGMQNIEEALCRADLS